MKGLLFVIFICGLLESSNSFSCYTCNSETGGACSREEAGNVTECAEGFGCLISEERSPKAGDFLLRECLAGQETDYKCETITSEDGVTVQTCACSTELCNKNWADAGSTQPNGETVKCYSCDSKTGECDDANTGTETDCPAWQGCYITKNNEDDYIRGCSVNSVPGCIDDGINHSCDCLTDLCNADWDTAGAESKMKCYSCDSHEGECDESHAGTEIDCSMEGGCSISTNVFDGKTLFSRGCSGELDTKGCNNEDNATTCICLEPLCNFDWSTAGSTTAGSDTTQPGKTIKCYSCDSKTGDCDDAHSGTETDCPAWQGCYITKNNEDDYIRGCSVNSVPGCIDDGINHSCDCLTDLCNADWDTAGAESKMKCYSCDSHEGECDESHAGTEIDCSMEEGCSISTNVFDGKTLFSRGCSGELDTKGCNNEDNSTTCICLETLCNFDWSTAGSTIAGSDTTQPSTVPGSAGKMLPAFSVVLGVSGAIVGILLL